MKYRKEIDGLRAIAVIPVILFHAGFEIFSGGFVGVDVFFVISGYLITTLIIEEKYQNKFTLISFYERRIRRILPALFTVMVVCIPFAWAWMPPGDMKDFSESLAAVVTFLSNVLFWTEAGYFDSGSELKPLLHTWSLAVEEQFYIIFPWLIWLCWRKEGGLKRLWLLIAIGFGSLLLSEWQATYHPNAAFFLVFGRFWELLIGAGAAIILTNPIQFTERLGIKENSVLYEFCGITGLSMIILSIFMFSESTPFPGIYAAVPVVGSTLIIVFGSGKTIVGRLLSWRPLVGIGLISYSAYLWHQPLFAYARYHDLGTWRQEWFVILTLSALILAWLTWRFIERPCRDRTVFTQKQIFGAALGASILFLIFGVTGHLNNGYIQYRGSTELQLMLKTTRRDPDAPDCTTGGANYRKPSDSCILGSGPTRVAIVGDSHASVIAYRTAKALEKHGMSLRQFSFSGCEPTHGLLDSKNPCSQWTKETVDFIKQSPEIEVVIVAYRLNTHLFGGHQRDYPKQATKVNENLRQERWKAYIALISDLTQAGKQVVVLLPIPEVKRRLADLIFMADDPAIPISGVSRTWWDARNSFVNQHRSDIPRDSLVIDPTDLFCDANDCWATKHGEALYFDHNHLSRAGMLPLAQMIADCMITHGFPLTGEFSKTPGLCTIRPSF